MTTPHPNPVCPVHGTDEVLIGCPCNDMAEADGPHPMVKDLVAALEASLAEAKAIIEKRRVEG